MEAPRWARVRGDVNCRIRRGAWYQVVQLTPDVAVLRVGDRSLSVPREMLRIVLVRPRAWSVVRRPFDAVDLPRSWGSQYAVCPACQHRVPIEHHQTELCCETCGMTGGIAWRETD
jgi:hypothetical protein